MNRSVSLNMVTVYLPSRRPRSKQSAVAVDRLVDVPVDPQVLEGPAAVPRPELLEPLVRGKLTHPLGEGIVQFTNGVTFYALLTARGHEHEAIGERGTVASLNNGRDWQVRRPTDDKRQGLVPAPFPDYERRSSTLGLIEDLVRCLDTGEPGRGGAGIARASTEIIFAFIESHRRGGARVELSLTESRVRLQRSTAPRTPKMSA